VEGVVSQTQNSGIQRAHRHLPLCFLLMLQFDALFAAAMSGMTLMPSECCFTSLSPCQWIMLKKKQKNKKISLRIKNSLQHLPTSRHRTQTRCSFEPSVCHHWNLSYSYKTDVQRGAVRFPVFCLWVCLAWILYLRQPVWSRWMTKTNLHRHNVWHAHFDTLPSTALYSIIKDSYSQLLKYRLIRKLKNKWALA